MINMSNCPCTGINLDKFLQPAILMILLRGALHGYILIEDIAQTPMFQGVRPDASGVYRYLKLMEERELINSSWSIEDTGPAKRIYQITDKGYQCLLEWKNTLEEYRDNIAQLVEKIEQAIIVGSNK